MLGLLQRPLNAINRYASCKSVDVDLIVNHYRSQTAKPLKRLPEVMPKVLSTVTMGLGDTMMMTDLARAAAQQKKDLTCFSGSPHFLQLMHFNPIWKQHEDKAFMINAPDMVRQYDCGNGHYLQRIRRAFGLKVDDCPRGCVMWSGMRHEHKVILHFEPGVHVQWQQQEVHPRARQLYQETKVALERFIQESPQYDFIQVGRQSMGIYGATWRPTASTVQLVEEIANATWFIVIMSGPLHVATALELKCIVIINFPDSNSIFLPTLKVTGQVEEEWLYPQNVHLHQDADGPLVKKVSTENFHRAFNGEIYPYWSKSYLSLIHEKL